MGNEADTAKGLGGLLKDRYPDPPHANQRQDSIAEVSVMKPDAAKRGVQCLTWRPRARPAASATAAVNHNSVAAVATAWAFLSFLAYQVKAIPAVGTAISAKRN